MHAKTQEQIPILTIAGSDCSGGAGIQADLKTFAAHKLYGMSVIVSVVAENTARVVSCFDLPRANVDEQMLAVFEDIVPRAVKIGMLPSKELMSTIAANLTRYKPQNIVIDPVMFAKNGYPLMPPENAEFFAKTMLKFADILTPNIPEAEFLVNFKIKTEQDMINAGLKLCEMGAKAALIKGGHNKSNANDVFVELGEVKVLKSKRIETKNTHGTGCTLSSAIAANLALGAGKFEAVKAAKDFVFGAILNSLNLGRGNGPTNHLWRMP